jgi:hypothetical protein
MCCGVRDHDNYTKHTKPKTNSAAHASLRTAVRSVMYTKKKRKRKGSALDMELHFTVSEKHF